MPLRGLRIDQEGQAFPESLIIALPDMAFYTGPSYPEGNFRRNQLLGSSMSLSPLCFTSTSNLHVSTEANFHHSFPWLHCCPV